MQNARMLLYLNAFYRIISRFELLNGAESVPPVETKLNYLHAVSFMQRENESLDIAVIDDFITAGEAVPGSNELFVVNTLFLRLLLNAVSRDKSPDFAVYEVIFFIVGDHCDRCIIIRQRQVKTEIHLFSPPEVSLFRSLAQPDLRYLDISLNTESLVEDIHVLAQEILPVLLVEDRFLTLLDKIVEKPFRVHGNRICLIYSIVLRLPGVAALVLIVRLIEQRKACLTSDKAVKSLFRLVYLRQHRVIVFRILS